MKQQPGCPEVFPPLIIATPMQYVNLKLSNISVSYQREYSHCV
jgi:hypothetical protein